MAKHYHNIRESLVKTARLLRALSALVIRRVTAVESQTYACASRKNHTELRFIYISEAYKLRCIRLYCVNLLTKVLINSKDAF